MHKSVLEVPCAFLFSNGNAAYFNEKEQQIVSLQKHGWKGLHKFHKKYPTAPVFFRGSDPMPQECIPEILKHIKTSDE